MKFLNKNFKELETFAKSKNKEYINSSPFPHIVIDNFFNENMLNDILSEFPKNLDNIGYQYKTKVEQKKFTLNDSKLLSENTSNFINYFTPVRFNRYNTGTKMRKHYDFIQSIFDGQSKFSTPYKGVPILSLVGVLNNDYEGGEFVFNDNHIVTLSTGDVLIFPSTFMYAHEVKEITKGKRYSFVSWGF